MMSERILAILRRAAGRIPCAALLILVTGTVLWTQDHRPQAAGGGAQSAAPSEQNPLETPQFAQLMTSMSNWGRWGAQDQLGTVNLITDQKRKNAAALIRTGTSVPLSRQYRIVPGAEGNPFNIVPSLFKSGLTAGAVDRIDTPAHSTTITHFDALCHFSFKGKTYNGLSFDDVVTKDGGCAKLGVGNVQGRVVTRGILVDIARLKGVPYLEPGTHIFRADIEEWEKRVGVKLGPGDAMLLRTGRWAREDAHVGPTPGAYAGLDVSALPFFKERDVALIGSDWVNDITPAGGPAHIFGLVALGMPLVDALDLEALATRAAELRRWEFFLEVSPVGAANSTGGPVNPIAVF
jgi:kynurenine formamidase